MIKEYILTVISVSIAGLLADALLPDGNIKKYANFAVSLVLSFALIYPAINLTNKNVNVLFDNIEYKFDYTVAVKSTVNSVEGFEDASVSVEQENNKIKSITVILKSDKLLERAEEELKKDFLIKILSAVYGTDNIYFSG